ncbi:hypothetical protein [Paenibacillus sp. SN-8-1]|uniref:hypothetical protein n=1 Tax=Paenibacillus sp. SN-8-1 TaxID=3435409 RepID=UPI003D9AADF8
MKKQLFIAGVVGVIALGGGSFLYQQSFAAEGEKSPVQVTQPAQVQVQANNPSELLVKPDKQAEAPPGVVDILKVPNGENLLPKAILESSNGKAKTSSVEANSAVTPSESKVSARKTEEGYILRTVYHLSNGAEVICSQAPSKIDPDAGVQKLQEAYSQEKVEVTDINGNVAAYVDGEKRKVVHLITKNHLFTASTVNGTLDDLFNVVKQIQE